MRGTSYALRSFILPVGLATAIAAAVHWAWPLQAELIAFVAALTSALLIPLLRRPAGASHKIFADKVSEEIDHILISAAETSYFVESIRTKVKKISAPPTISSTTQNRMPSESNRSRPTPNAHRKPWPRCASRAPRAAPKPR